MSSIPTLFIQGATYNYGPNEKKEQYVCTKVINEGKNCTIAVKQYLDSQWPTYRQEKTIDITQAGSFISPENLTEAEIWLSSNKVIANSFEKDQDYYIIHYDDKNNILQLTCTSTESGPLFKVEGCVNQSTGKKNPMNEEYFSCMKTTLESVELSTIESLYKENPNFNKIVPSFYRNNPDLTPAPAPAPATPVQEPKTVFFFIF